MYICTSVETVKMWDWECFPTMSEQFGNFWHLQPFISSLVFFFPQLKMANYSKDVAGWASLGSTGNVKMALCRLERVSG